MIYLFVFYFESSDPKPTHKIWFELTGLVVIDTDCIDSCKFNSHDCPKVCCKNFVNQYYKYSTKLFTYKHGLHEFYRAFW